MSKADKVSSRSAKKPAPKKPAVRNTKQEARKGKKAAARRATKPNPIVRRAKFALGQIVRHRVYPFRGVVFDIDPVFNNSEEWWLAIPAEIRPVKDQPYYHLLAENAETEYIAYVSEQNLLPDDSALPLRHPQLGEFFVEDEDGQLRAVFIQRN